MSLEELYANISLEDEGDEGVIVGKDSIIENKQKYVLVGRFLTEKNINFNAMQNVMASLWRPKEGVEIHDLGEFRYSFVFYHKLDLQKVVEGGPWSFEQSMLITKQMEDGEEPLSIQLKEVDIWVQVYDLLQGCLSENVLRSVGSSIGKYVKSDPDSFDGMWKAFVRIRVTMNIEKPLKRRMKIKKEGDKWSWINFKYERLSTFCFVCGILGHSERDCSIVYAHPDKVIDRAYGVWLRAPFKNAKSNVGSRWLRNSSSGGGQWTQTTVQGGASMEEKFMEVDGVISEISGSDEAFRVRQRDMGDRSVSN